MRRGAHLGMTESDGVPWLKLKQGLTLRGYFLCAAHLTASSQGLFEQRDPPTPASRVAVSLGR